jgi:hypothetical protein
MRSPSLGCIPEPRNYAREARTTSDAPPEKPRRRNEILRLTGCLLRGFLCAAGATLDIAKTALSAQEMASSQRYFGSLLPTGRRLHASQRPVPSRVPANGWPAPPPPRGTSATCMTASAASASRPHPIWADGVPRCSDMRGHFRMAACDLGMKSWLFLRGAARDAAGAHLPSRRHPCWKGRSWMTRGQRLRPRRQSLPIPAASIHAALAPGRAERPGPTAGERLCLRSSGRLPRPSTAAATARRE